VNVHYERLSNLDASFLALESRETHMHVGAVALFDAGPLRHPDGGIDIDSIRRHVDSKLHLIPRYRQRLAWVPVEGHPVWVDDDHFNLDYHLRHSSLPAPGNMEQLKKLTGRLMSQGLDRNKPMWELYFVEGLEGDRFAIVSKIHHAMVDGIAGIDLMAVLLDIAPSDEIVEAPLWEPRPAPNGTELFVRETSRRVTSLLARAAHIRSLPGELGSLTAEVRRRGRAVGASLGSGWLVPTGRTPINGPIGPNRRFDWLELELEDVKKVKNALGGSVNDVILATVAGGVRIFLLEERGMSADELERLHVRAMAPVSVRPRDKRGSLGNHVAMWLVSLPVGASDPVLRLDSVRSQTMNLKNTDQALGASTIVGLSTGAPTALVSMGARLASNVRPFNMTVTNVPGPQFPLFLLGGRLEATYPMVPLWQSHGVGIALFSYLGRVFWGVNSDFDLVADLPAFCSSLEAAFVELLKAAENVSDGEDAPDDGGDAAAEPRKRPPLGTS
jgi:diacylglycerol O-acyltransferase / wax synthase